MKANKKMFLVPEEQFKEFQESRLERKKVDTQNADSQTDDMLFEFLPDPPEDFLKYFAEVKEGKPSKKRRVSKSRIRPSKSGDISGLPLKALPLKGALGGPQESPWERIK